MVTSTVEQLDETKVKLTITVPAEDVAAAIDAAVDRLSRSIKVPGFRPGRRIPVKVLESRLGKGSVRDEAVRETVPGWFNEAVKEADLVAVSQPDFDIDTFEAGSEGSFTATFDVRPEFEVPDVEGLEVEHPEWEVSQEDVDASLEQMRERFAEVESVDRPAQQGDFVTVTITGKKSDGTEVEEASAEDLLYQIPEEQTESELDSQLVGAKAGEILNFTDVLGPDYPDGLAGQELDFTAIVKEVKVKVLPELDDDFALTASEFDTIEELIDDVREQLQEEKLQHARQNLRGTVVEAVAELVDIPVPEGMVNEEQQFRLNRLAHQAQQAGLSLEQFFAMAGGDDPEQLMQQIKEDAERTVKAQLVVDEIGQGAGITVERNDLGEEVARQSMRMGRDPNEVAELMMHPDRIGALYADTYRRKTIDHLLEVVTITGAPPEEPAEDQEAEKPAESEEAQVEEPSVDEEE